MTNVRTITVDGLETELNRLNEKTSTTITWKVPYRGKKYEDGIGSTPNPFHGRIEKLSKVSGYIYWNYAKEVNDQRGREQGVELINGQPVAVSVEEFKPKERPWGHRIPDSPFVEHTRKSDGEYNLYLETLVNKYHNTEYRWIDSGQLLTDDEVSHAKTFVTPASSSRQGLKSEIDLKDPMLKNITSLTLVDKDQTFILA